MSKNGDPTPEIEIDPQWRSKERLAYFPPYVCPHDVVVKHGVQKTIGLIEWGEAHCLHCGVKRHG